MTVNSFGHDLSQVAVVNIRTQENDWIKGLSPCHQSAFSL
jgi:hypothetical protein